MPAFSYYSEQELERSFDLVSLHNPLLAQLLIEVNSKIGTGPRYYVWAREQFKKKRFWSKLEFNGLRIDLLYGDITHSLEMQICNFGCNETALMGFLNGYSRARQDEPQPSWDRFIKLLNKKDKIDATNFIGSVARYKDIFLEANK